MYSMIFSISFLFQIFDIFYGYSIYSKYLFDEFAKLSMVVFDYNISFFCFCFCFFLNLKLKFSFFKARPVCCFFLSSKKEIQKTKRRDEEQTKNRRAYEEQRKVMTAN